MKKLKKSLSLILFVFLVLGVSAMFSSCATMRLVNKYILNNDNDTLVAIAVSGTYRTEYAVGEDFDTDKIEVTAYYASGNSKRVNDYEISKDKDLQPSDEEIVVSYTSNDVTVTASIKITVAVPARSHYILTIQDGINVTFAGGAKTAEVAPGGAMPEIVNGTGRAIIGWYNVADKSTLYDATTVFQMPSDDITIAPCFDVEEGYNQYMPALNNSYTSGAGCTSTGVAGIVEGGTTGYTTLGSVLEISGEFKQGIRFDTKLNVVPEGAVGISILEGAKIEYVYTFQNNGTEAITFKAHQIYTLKTIDGKCHDLGNGEITLEAGESITFKYTYTHPKTDKNDNSLLLLTFDRAESSVTIKLGVAMSAKLVD